MSTLYVYNIGRQIHIQIDNIHVQYLGSKVLNRFIKVNNYADGCISIDTEFKIENKYVIEEDYIDLRDVFSDYNYDTDSIINSITKIEIGVPTMNKITRDDLIKRSLMVSDNMALMYKKDDSTDKTHILVVNMKDTKAKAIISIPDYKVINSNMSDAMLIRAKEAVKRNYEQLLEEIKERNIYA